MAYGSFFLILNPNAKIEKKVVFFESESPIKALEENVLLRIRMGHSDKNFVLNYFPDFQVYSHKSEVRDKGRNFTFIGGVILDKEENSVFHKDALKSFVTRMEENRNKTEEELNGSLIEFYPIYFERPNIILDEKEVEKRLSERVKSLNVDGKFDEANDFLAKMKKVPKKLYKTHETAERALREGDYEKAKKEFRNAKKFATMLGEKDLESMYKGKIQLAKKTPDLLKKRESLVEQAVNTLKKGFFDKAQRAFKKAGDISEELMDSKHAEEYSLKAKALAEYTLVDKKYSK
ncbi:hypothetical protein DSAG12_00121 [Promethearchaeum syntrophicum]|uniref:Uncharacterized protein n=1 Tax=Promethearchaeum syntrophicum TaxID=2594042 RepID=A0A5B9D5C4_9ARCH|nr:hypothetical protein [Candidatus Prometheoarchaeum syntrophicum]QEE14309.1 hypothetical protein DSAG12_00121 [Candidatus Prometheoarchaeum syntrophicum]